MAEKDPFYTKPGDEWTGGDLSLPDATMRPEIQPTGTSDLGSVMHAARLGISNTGDIDPPAFKKYVLRPSYTLDSSLSEEELIEIRFERMSRKSRAGNFPAGIIDLADL